MALAAVRSLRSPALLLLICAAAGAAPLEGTVPSTPDAAAPAFRVEGRPAIDDVFGDSSDYRRTIDRFLELTSAMQALRDDFSRAVQSILAQLASRPGGRPNGPRHGCPSAEVANPYAKAHHLGAEYLRIGHELARHYEQVKDYDRLGETVGLTPDYRWKVKRVLLQYASLLTDYKEMKVAFHDQLNDELRYAGCDLALLLVRGDPQHKGDQPGAWPQPGQPGAPGVLPRLAQNEPERATHPPSSLPTEKVPAPQLIPLPRRPSDDRDPQPRSGILFYVDNLRCQRGTVVFVDGKRLGDVPAATRVGFQTVPGPHDLCLLDDPQKRCGAPGTVRRSYLHEGWTISLRCE